MSDNTTLTEILKLETRFDHEELDKQLHGYQVFKNQQNYAKFLQVQEVFQRIVHNIYCDSDLNVKMPNLSSLSRYGKVQEDMLDLHVSNFVIDSLPTPQGLDAIGWLYCAEGSNLGVAFLLKVASKLGLSGDYGARHLASHPDGRAKHWKAFSQMLNVTAGDIDSYAPIIHGAKNSFGYYRFVAQKVFI